MMADTALDMQTDSGKAQRACAFCMDEFHPRKFSQRFCCDLCREEHLAGSRRAKAFDPSTATRSCKGCGGSFVVSDPRELFCTQECKVEHFARVRNETGQGARITREWRNRNPQKYAESVRKGAKRRYANIKADPESYNQWRKKMSAYETVDGKRQAQRARKSQAALATLLLPTPKNLGANQ